MKRIFTRLTAVATIGVALGLTPAVMAQGTNSPAPRPQRIVIVNIAKVLRDYNKANFLGAEITKKRETYVGLVTKYRAELAEIQKQFQQHPQSRSEEAAAG